MNRRWVTAAPITADVKSLSRKSALAEKVCASYFIFGARFIACPLLEGITFISVFGTVLPTQYSLCQCSINNEKAGDREADRMATSVHLLLPLCCSENHGGAISFSRFEGQTVCVSRH